MAFRMTVGRCFAVRPLPSLGAPCLRDVAKLVPEDMFNSPELDSLVEDLIDTMHDANGAGIAAPQIDEPWRVFVVHGTGNNPRYPYKPAVPLTVFINPEIEVLDDTPMHMIEGCLSIPGVRGRVQRACKVRCTARRPDGSEFVLRAEGHVAGTLQHELDHLNGQLFPDITEASGLMTWEAFDQHHKDSFFQYAADINEKYPTPIVWETGAPKDQSNNKGDGKTEEESKSQGKKCGGKQRAYVRDDTSIVRSSKTTYAPGLTWVNGKFERGYHVTVNEETGRIISVMDSLSSHCENGDARQDSDDNGGAKVVHLPDNILLPGFVNAHSHAFQRGLRGRGETYPKTSENDREVPSFWTWREAMYGLVTELNSVDAFKRQTKQCFQEMAAAGITTCGEFHYFRHSASKRGGINFDHDAAVVEAAREANVRLVLLNAWYERGGFDDSPLSEGQQRFCTDDMDVYWKQMDRMSSILGDQVGTRRGDALGFVAHSSRATSVASLKHLAAEAHKRGLIMHLHLEEQQKEIDDCFKVHGCTPMELLLRSVPSDHLSNTCAVHCTHSKVDELERFVEAGATVCVCPLTEASLGDGVFLPLEATRGNVSLGTDCNARIDMFEEMRWLEYSQRLFRMRRGVFSSVGDDTEGRLASQLLNCATVNGAKSLAIETGEISVGKWADFALLDLHASALTGVTDANLLGAAILGGSAEGLVVDSCVAGRWTRGIV